jgi:hypothetical protein
LSITIIAKKFDFVNSLDFFSNKVKNKKNR